VEVRNNWPSDFSFSTFILFIRTVHFVDEILLGVNEIKMSDNTLFP
jgi:hypothetical protein